MTSNWALPTQVYQYSEQGAEDSHVSWQDVNDFYSLKNKDGRSVKTSRELLHIARDPKRDITEKTYYMRITGFNFLNLPNTVSGIELRLTMNRFGRITDESVHLCLNEELIGKNQATLDVNPIKIYGSETSLWDTNLTKENLLDPTFGVVLRFQSHPNWPHRNSAMIDSVEIRVH